MSVAVQGTPPIKIQPLLPLLIVAAGGAMTGFSGVFVRLSEIGPFATAGWRLAIAAIAFLPLLHLDRNRTAGDMRLSPLLVAAGLLFAVDMGFYNLALSYTTIAHSTLIVNLAPLVAMSAGFLLFGERFGNATIFGLVAALGGAALMTLTRADGGGTLFGNGLSLVAMLGYALYLVAVKHARESHGTLAIMIWTSVVGAASLFVAALLAGETLIPVSATGWLILLALGLIAHVMGQGVVAFGMRQVPVGLASIILLIQPTVAALAAWAVFGEGMGPLEAGGAALVLTGLIVASRSRA
jgi:drug/metabolite transporter (DMT)-like permease